MAAPEEEDNRGHPFPDAINALEEVEVSAPQQPPPLLPAPPPLLPRQDLAQLPRFAPPIEGGGRMEWIPRLRASNHRRFRHHGGGGGGGGASGWPLLGNPSPWRDRGGNSSSPSACQSFLMEWMRDKAKREPSQPPPSASPSEGWNQVVSDLYDASNGGDGENGDLSDVTFVLTEEDGTEVKFAAHRLLLSLRSPVFRAMFHGPLRDDSGLVRVEDVSPKAFETMITYMYKGEDNAGASSWMATPANAWQLWYAAKKYMLDSLEEKCRKYLKAHLTPLNVLDTYSFAERYGDPQVLYQCLRLIDRHARYILASPGFTCLPLRLARSILERRTLSAREVDVFEAAVRWVQSELARRMSDGSEGAVPSTAQIFREDFQGLVRFDQFSSEEFVHQVLSQGVLDQDSVSRVAADIKAAECAAAAVAAVATPLPAASADPVFAKPATSSTVAASRLPPIAETEGQQESRTGLNQARDMVHETPSPSSSSLSPTDDEKNALLKEGVIHTAADDDRGERGGEATARGERLGPGCFQLCRFDPSHDLALAWKWPREYTLRFKVSRDVFLLGAGITETDRQFYSPNVRYMLTIKGPGGETLSEGKGGLFFHKRTHSAPSDSSVNSSRSPNDRTKHYSPHDVALKTPTHVASNCWHELCLRVSEDLWSVCPLLVVRCGSSAEAFGAHFEFEPGVAFGRRRNGLETLGSSSSEAAGEAAGRELRGTERRSSAATAEAVLEAASRWGRGDTTEEEEEEDDDDDEKKGEEEEEEEEGFHYGLISRLYFYY